jgi:exopolysaccharide production protein ExoQ
LNPLFPKRLINILEILLITYLLLSVAGFHEPPRFLTLLMGAGYITFSALAMFFHWKRMVYIMSKDVVLCSLILLAIASIIWSSNPDATSFNLKYLIRITLFSTYLSIRYSPRDLIRLFSWTAIVAMLLSVGFGILFPADSIQNMGTAWIGIFSHKQGVGVYMGLAATLFSVQCLDKQSHRWAGLIGLASTLVFILLSQSKTGLILWILPLSLMPLYKISKQGKHRGALLAIALIVGCLTAATVIFNLETIVVSWLGKDLEFNGRLPLWIPSIAKGMERLWLGYGMHGFWTSDVSDTVLFNTWLGQDEDFKVRSVIANAHQGFIDLFLQLGLVGITLFFTSFILLLKRVIDLLLWTRSIEYFWMLLFIGYFLVSNLVESSIILEQGNAWIIYVTISLSSALEYHRIHSRPSKVTRSRSIPQKTGTGSLSA